MAKQKPKSPVADAFGWLGRQIGHVKKAVKTDVTKDKPVPPKPPAQPAKPQVVYRDDKVEEAPHPTKPGMKLRRTVIDEVIIDDPSKPVR